MSRLVGIHYLTLHEGITPEAFEQFVRDEVPNYVKLTPAGWTYRVLKGVRGQRKDQYTVLIEIPDATTRDALMDENGQPLESPTSPEYAAFRDKWMVMVSGMAEVFTDYIEIEY